MCFNTTEEHYKSKRIADVVPSADAPRQPLPTAFPPCQALLKAVFKPCICKDWDREGKDCEKNQSRMVGMRLHSWVTAWRGELLTSHWNFPLMRKIL